jgi:MoxR-like ATPase
VEDAKEVAPSVLRHRIIPNFTAEADGISSLDIIQKLLDTTPSVDGKRS